MIPPSPTPKRSSTEPSRCLAGPHPGEDPEPRRPTDLPSGSLSVVLDTNVFIAAGFRPGSDAARVLRAVEGGRLRMVWHASTRRETEALLRKIPPLSWDAVTRLFTDEGRWEGPLDPDAWVEVPDPEDRKFAALAAASGATLVTLDRHLLDAESGTAFVTLSPREFARSHLEP